MPTVFLDAVFKPSFKIAHDTGQQLTIDRTNFLTDGFLQIIQRTRFVSVNTRFQVPPREKNHTLKDRESEEATARLRNGKWGVRETCFEQWSLTRCSPGQVSIATDVANQKGKNADHLVPPLGLPTEYYPFKRCQVPVGHSVHVWSVLCTIPGCITDAAETLNTVILHSVKTCKKALVTEFLTLNSFVISACCSTMSPPEKSVATDTPVTPSSKPSVMEMEMIRPDLESRCTWRPNLEKTLSPHNHIPLQWVQFFLMEGTLRLLLAVVPVLLKKRLFDGCENAEINQYVHTYPWKYLSTSYKFLSTLSNLSCMYAEVWCNKFCFGPEADP